MKRITYKITTLLFACIMLLSTSCDKYLDINKDPDNILDGPLPQLLSSVTVNIGYFAGSDMQRWSALIMQQYSGQSTGSENQTQVFDRYQIQGNDANNVFSTIYATILNDIDNIIAKSGTASPHYSGVAKILKAYVMQIAVDNFGDLPFSEAGKLLVNPTPKYDDDKVIYTELVKLLDQGITEVNAATSVLSPTTNSTIYPNASFATSKVNWVKFANTLKLRIYLHYSQSDNAFYKAQTTALINSGATFLASNADNFQMAFLNEANRRNPIDQMEVSRANYLVAGAKLVDMMNTRLDPRRATYFTQVGGAYKGAVTGAPAAAATYSKIGLYLRGGSGTTYTGAAPIRMLTFAEYNFIRAEAALDGAGAGVAQTFFQAGITASMTDAGVAAADITTYLAANGLLAGTTEAMRQRIIEEKYVASYGVITEPWTDWRRTGYPALTIPANAVLTAVPRSLFYPQSEIDFNGANVTQKANMLVRVFWDTRP
ncbi:SusD/RagB family nutrient-binding outer membrane lipoprotein [Hufsiella ginkgonis]|uniref:SusD/RagB family nutrient-binding outer membrane lipoprotein n=1 Tax=Hufsiella ginkgonis TaxID=2695274 RepID=A0A7K1XSY1_9SPHI|nr:SusD/RagB family nutrient-binding outer membrane lipoprotein [Hufsiella ginkgonis]MXV13987.1 SusD/RagB family nutrient-binding outer membrane lipoprotein [Hufsiella ginkgonis]